MYTLIILSPFISYHKSILNCRTAIAYSSLLPLLINDNYNESIKRKTLEGKIVVITGADSGRGQAIANELSSCGAHIAIDYFDDDKGAKKH